jgi:hypothetical protein
MFGLMSSVYQNAIDETQRELDAVEHAISALNERADFLREYIEHTRRVMQRAPVALATTVTA